MSVTIRNVSKRFGTFPALHDVSIDVLPGELLGLLGPSGSGKTTLLRVIGGLEFPDAGDVVLHGETVTHWSPAERGIGFVFQHYALFRHMTVFENIAFGLSVRRRAMRPDRSVIRRKVTELLELVQLGEYGHRLPSQLSGGQRQRVALARALAIEPKVLLLDEPFGALDAKVRKELRRWIRRLHQEIHITSIFVTHDQDEALEVADRVVVMNAGRIEQAGTPNAVYGEPATAFVYRFLGRALMLAARIDEGALLLGDRRLCAPDALRKHHGGVTVFARPQDVAISPAPTQNPGVAALVKDVNHAGPLIYLELQRLDDGADIQIEIPARDHLEMDYASGQQVYLGLKKYRIYPDH